MASIAVCVCPSNEGSVFGRLIAEMMVGLHDLYMSLIVVSSTLISDNNERVLQVGELEIVVDMFYLVVC